MPGLRCWMLFCGLLLWQLKHNSFCLYNFTAGSAARGIRFTTQSTVHVHKVPTFLKTRVLLSFVKEYKLLALWFITNSAARTAFTYAADTWSIFKGPLLWSTIENIHHPHIINISFRPCLQLCGLSSSHARVHSLKHTRTPLSRFLLLII